MKKIILLLATAIAFATVSCQNDRAITSDLESTEQNSNDNNPSVYAGIQFPRSGEAIPGTIIIKVSQDTYDTIEKGAMAENMQLRSAPAPMLKALTSIKASNIERLFPHAGKFEKRSVRDGMHLWLKVTFDDQVPVAEAMQSMLNTEGVEIVEFDREITFASSKPSPFAFTDRVDGWRFNDPLLPRQYHYNNLGQSTNKVNGAVMGADINLMRAWEIETGDANVIVCVVDGCIQVDHPDLVENIWRNEAELAGTVGVDDDNNGYKDDFHGWNFVNNTNKYIPDKAYHGTHVAGTVAARNHNGIGVAGVAGGDGTARSGIKMMTAGIFSTAGTGGDSAAAIKYGADNGAVISQNSWGYTMPGSTSPSMRAAIDYFIKNAGCDNDGNQLPDSPMKGGVVFFAAGNDDSEQRFAPAEYGPSFSVSAMGPDFTKASYSNYGTWTDIMAPGGDQDRYGIRSGVLSTYDVNSNYGISDANGYAWYQGTSMACPHVSGIAALVVSHRGKQGFTAKELEQIMCAAVHDTYVHNPDYSGKLGVGYIDAYLALTIENKNMAPEAPKFLPEKSLSDQFLSATIYWTVPKDADDSAPSRYNLYISDKPLNASNYTQAKILGNVSGYVPGNGLAAGQEMSYQVNDLNHSSTYYFAIVAIDRWGLKSAPAFMETKTKTNNPPVIKNAPTDPIVLLDILGSTDYLLEIDEPDGQTWRFATSGETSGVTLTKTDKGINIRIRPVLAAGEHKFNLTITDELGSTASSEIPFQIVNVKAPELVAPLPNVLIGVENEPLTADIANVFKPQPMLNFTYKVTSSNGSVASATLDGTKITVKGHQPGQAVINIAVSNGHYESRTSFEVSVTKNKNMEVYAIWPLPMKDQLNLWVNPNSTKPVVTIYSLMGEKVLEKTLLVDHEGKSTLQVKGLAPGSYRIRVEGTGKEAFEQVVQKR